MAGFKLHVQLVLVATAFLGFSVFMLGSYWNSSPGSSFTLSSLRLLFATVSLIISLAYFWALSRWPSPNLTLGKLTGMLVIKLLSVTLSRMTVRQIEASWRAPRQYQEQLLQDIIRENGDTEYGRRYDLKTVGSLEELRRRHPLTDYEQYRCYVERMMEGEENVLTRKKPTSYVRTTGTTGKAKHYPYTSRFGFLTKFTSCLKWYLVENYPSLGQMRRTVFFYVHPIVTKAKSGANMETIGTLPDLPAFLLSGFTTPKAGFNINSLREAYYIHFLFGLREANIACVNIGFLTFLKTALNQLKGYWRDIVHDIETGTINRDIELPAEVRAKLTSALAGRGDPERARQLRQEFEKGFDGIMKRVWPQLDVILSIDNTKLWPEFERKFAKGASLFSFAYVCSEGFFACNLGRKLKDPNVSGYIPLPSNIIMEFIKVEEIYESQPKTLFIDEVEVGQCYELVLTQGASGYYRFRFGDVIKVTGFHDNCPIIDFAFRIGQMLNLHYEKLDQKVVDEAIRASVARWPGRSLVEFTVAESTLIPEDSRKQFSDDDIPNYVFFIELEGRDNTEIDSRVSDVEKAMVDEEISHRNADYARLRREGSIAVPKVIAVRPGAFDILKTYILEHTNATAIQYKNPRKLRAFEMFQVMADLAL